MPLIIAYSAIYLAENPAISMLLAVPGVEVTTTFHMMHIKVIHTRSQRQDFGQPDKLTYALVQVRNAIKIPLNYPRTINQASQVFQMMKKLPSHMFSCSSIDKGARESITMSRFHFHMHKLATTNHNYYRHFLVFSAYNNSSTITPSKVVPNAPAKAHI